MSSDPSHQQFEDFDDARVFPRFESSILSAESLNFVLEFDSAKALGALDLDLDGFKRLLTADRTSTSTTRWINIWAPEKQKEVLKTMARHYGFSPRLLGLMCSEPLKPVPVTIAPPQSRMQEFIHYRNNTPRKSMQDDVFDLEGHMEMAEKHSLNRNVLDLNHYRIANEVWHFCSTDWGPDYLCAGYNSLHDTRMPPPAEAVTTRRGQNKPSGKRLWTWLMLCNDDTVITIHENPYPEQSDPLTTKEIEVIGIIRRNLLNVFRQLSKAKDADRSQNPVMTLPIRSGLLPLPDHDGHKSKLSATDAPSLLFYYLFDDWYTSYSLVARREHQYAAQLEYLRDRMFKKADLDHIDRLHHLGRQLAVLKRIYQSYDLIIERILERQKPFNKAVAPAPDTAGGVRALMDAIHEEDTLVPPREDEAISFGVSLSTAAIVRFERLKDRIRLYALSEIQECLDEKEALVLLNFNLIAIKQSNAVERLTRITILLAKVTILFMPVSLMTAYFSVQIPNLATDYTVRTYWASFAVIMTLSFLFLFVFGKLSGTLEGQPIYRSLTETFFDMSRQACGRKRRKSLDDKGGPYRYPD